MFLSQGSVVQEAERGIPRHCPHSWLGARLHFLASPFFVLPPTLHPLTSSRGRDVAGSACATITSDEHTTKAGDASPQRLDDAKYKSVQGVSRSRHFDFGMTQSNHMTTPGEKARDPVLAVENDWRSWHLGTPGTQLEHIMVGTLTALRVGRHLFSRSLGPIHFFIHNPT